MSCNVIVLADVHIDDYRYYNPTDEDYIDQGLVGIKDNYRLNQCITLANALVSYGKRIDCKDLFILGDLVHKNRPIPRVIKKTQEFLEILSSYFNTYYILGNHDVDATSNDIAVENSVIPVIMKYLPNVTYVNNSTVIRRNGMGESISFHFKDYQYDTSTVDYGDCDVALGHLTLSFGQSAIGNYKLGVFGDIHEPIDLGRDHSVGTPYQLFPSQPEVGSIGLIDYNKDLKFKRVSGDYILTLYDEEVINNG